MKHPWRQVAIQQHDYKLRRSGIFIAPGVNPRKKKHKTGFGGIFAAWQAKIMTKQNHNISNSLCGIIFKFHRVNKIINT